MNLGDSLREFMLAKDAEYEMYDSVKFLRWLERKRDEAGTTAIWQTLNALVVDFHKQFMGKTDGQR